MPIVFIISSLKYASESKGSKTRPARWVSFMSSALNNFEESIHHDY